MKGTIDDLTTINFHLVLSSAVLVELSKSLPFHFLILCLACHTVFLTCPATLSLLTQKAFRCGRIISVSVSCQKSDYPVADWICLRTSSVVTWNLNEIFSSLRQHLISKICILFSYIWSMITGIQKYGLTREHISFTLDLREMLLFIHIGFSFVRVAMAWAILREPPVLSLHLRQLLQGT